MKSCDELKAEMVAIQQKLVDDKKNSLVDSKKLSDCVSCLGLKLICFKVI